MEQARNQACRAVRADNAQREARMSAPSVKPGDRFRERSAKRTSWLTALIAG
jgi:hypothetical protein